MYWPRGDPSDQLPSRRLRGMAFAVGGIGFAPVILAFALDLPTLAVGFIVALWLVATYGLFIGYAVADNRERREALRRNAALDWPRGRPPRHPGWAFGALLVWGCLEPVARTTSSNVIAMTWLVVLFLGIGCVLVMAWRRLRWEYRVSQRDEEEP